MAWRKLRRLSRAPFDRPSPDRQARSVLAAQTIQRGADLLPPRGACGSPADHRASRTNRSVGAFGPGTEDFRPFRSAAVVKGQKPFFAHLADHATADGHLADGAASLAMTAAVAATGPFLARRHRVFGPRPPWASPPKEWIAGSPRVAASARPRPERHASSERRGPAPHRQRARPHKPQGRQSGHAQPLETRQQRRRPPRRRRGNG